MIHEEQNICIVNGAKIEIDVGMLYACLCKCSQQMCNSHYLTAEIFTNSREPSGWIEFGIVLRTATGSVFRIGAIQRTPGAEYEFHS
jgi:hypothetical protein